jgi:glutathione S-transferase
MTQLAFYHAPHTRSSMIRALLEELAAPYDLHVVDFAAGDQRKPDYLAINPLGKLPAIIDDGVLITETVAIALYLADKFPQAGLAPAIGDKLRGPYLRWLVFYAAAMEPAFVDRALKREPGHQAMSPYGSWDAVFDTVLAQLRQGPWMLGETFTAADVIWGGALHFMSDFGLLPENDVVPSYLARVHARPAMIAAREADNAWAART